MAGRRSMKWVQHAEKLGSFCGKQKSLVVLPAMRSLDLDRRAGRGCTRRRAARTLSRRFCRKGNCPNVSQTRCLLVPLSAILSGFGALGGFFGKGQFCLVTPMFTWLYASVETWPSGRRRSPAKGVDRKLSRGFESLRLRHFPQNAPLYIARKPVKQGFSATSCTALFPSHK